MGIRTQQKLNSNKRWKVGTSAYSSCDLTDLPIEGYTKATFICTEVTNGTI